jgi:hypothetical protein
MLKNMSLNFDPQKWQKTPPFSHITAPKKIFRANLRSLLLPASQNNPDMMFIAKK